VSKKAFGPQLNRHFPVFELRKPLTDLCFSHGFVTESVLSILYVLWTSAAFPPWFNFKEVLFSTVTSITNSIRCVQVKHNKFIMEYRVK